MDRPSAWSKDRNRSSQILIGCLVLIIVIGISTAIALGVLFCTSKTDNEICFTPDSIHRASKVLQLTNSTDNETCFSPQSIHAISKSLEVTDSSTNEICFTSGCIHTASRILDMMDPEVDPCDDFYQFSCGNFIKETNIPDERSVISTASVINDLVVGHMRALIEEPFQENESKPVILIKKLYKACMNKTLIEEIGLKNVKVLIKDFGGWPVLDGTNWNKKHFDWKKLTYKFSRYGFDIDYLIMLFLDVDQKNSSKYFINVDQPFLKLPREILIEGLKDKYVQAYYDYMVDIAVLFGANKFTALREMGEVINFEIQLANISDPNEERRDAAALYNAMTIKELQAKYTSIPWNEYVDNIFAPYQKFNEEDIIVVNSIRFFSQFEVLMSKTSPRVLANYLIWRAVSSTISYLPDELRKKQLVFNSVLTGETAMTPRWKECIDFSLNLDIASSALYVRKYFKEEARLNINTLVANIQAELKESLKKVNWMDEETRRHALEKADTVVTHIGYPIELLDDEKVEKYHDGLEVDENDYMKSSLNINRWNSGLSAKKLRLPVNKTEWISHSSSTAVNAFYSPNENSIQFPAGILQGIYFSNDRPNYMNYGGIGFIIGHEITHGFDDEGRQYDKNGNVMDWWVDETKKAFKERAQCVVEYYGNYTVSEIGSKLNGINTQGENIADIGGLKQAYLAYERWVKINGEESRLPGLDYTSRQLFWISAANIWCSKIRPEVLQQRVIDDAHSPDKYRVWGVVSNLNEFAEDFQCKVGSPMNPEHKCQLW